MCVRNGYQPIINFVKRVKNIEDSGFNIEAAAFVFIGIDMMTILSLPCNETRQTRSDFKKWVDDYFKADTNQPYLYNSDDMYAARCSVLHNYSSEADIHLQNTSIKKYGYHDGGQHAYDPSEAADLVLIGTKSFVNDFANAVLSFLQAAQNDADLKARIDSRINKVFSHFSIID